MCFSVASVVEVDLYHTAALMPLNDEQVTEIALRALTNAEPSFRAAKVTESNVLRAPQCATIFSPGSYRNRPAQQTPLPNLFLAGDYVRESPMHGADGLSQERALVTGLYMCMYMYRMCSVFNSNKHYIYMYRIPYGSVLQLYRYTQYMRVCACACVGGEVWGGGGRYMAR